MYVFICTLKSPDFQVVLSFELGMRIQKFLMSLYKVLGIQPHAYPKSVRTPQSVVFKYFEIQVSVIIQL